LKAYSLASIAALSDRIQEHFEQERKEDDIGKAYKSFCSLGRLVVKKNVDLVCNPEQSIQQVRALEDVAFVALLHFFALLCAPYPSNNVIRYVARSLSSFLSVVDGGTRKHLANDTKSDLLEHFLPASQKIFLWYVEKIPNLSLALSIQDFEYCIKELQDQTIQERKSGREQFFNFCVRQLSDDSFFPASSSPAASSPVLAQGSPSSAAPLSDQLSALAAVASEVSNTARAPVPAPSVAPAVSRSVSSASTPLAMQLISPTSTVVTAGVRPSFAADSISTQGDGGNKKEKGSDQDVELVENKQRDARGDDEEEDKEEVIVEVSRKRKSSGVCHIFVTTVCCVMLLVMACPTPPTPW